MSHNFTPLLIIAINLRSKCMNVNVLVCLRQPEGEKLISSQSQHFKDAWVNGVGKAGTLAKDYNFKYKKGRQKEGWILCTLHCMMFSSQKTQMSSFHSKMQALPGMLAPFFLFPMYPTNFTGTKLIPACYSNLRRESFHTQDSLSGIKFLT